MIDCLLRYATEACIRRDKGGEKGEILKIKKERWRQDIRCDDRRSIAKDQKDGGTGTDYEVQTAQTDKNRRADPTGLSGDQDRNEKAN